MLFENYNPLSIKLQENVKLSINLLLFFAVSCPTPRRSEPREQPSLQVVKVAKVVKVYHVFQNIPGSQLLSDFQTFFSWEPALRTVQSQYQALNQGCIFWYILPPRGKGGPKIALNGVLGAHKKHRS